MGVLKAGARKRDRGVKSGPQILFRDPVGGEHALDVEVVDREVGPESAPQLDDGDLLPGVQPVRRFVTRSRPPERKPKPCLRLQGRNHLIGLHKSNGYRMAR
jgi:hypothetical protein